MEDDGTWRQLIVPLGVPVSVIADDPELSAAVGHAYAEWSGDAGRTEPRIAIRLETAGAPSIAISCGIEVEGSRLRLHGRDHAAHADAAAGEAHATAPPRLVADPDALAAEIVDTLLLFLLTRSGRTPIHAAGVMIGDRAIALMGPSGSGKSSLALAAAKKGLRVLSEDTLYVEHGPPLRIWGWPRPVHLLPEDAPSEGHAIRERGGKRKAIVPLPAGSLFTGPADTIVPVMLERGEKVSLKRLDPGAARSAAPPLDPGFELLADDIEDVLKALLKHGAWRLTLGPVAGDAIDRLVAEFSSG